MISPLTLAYGISTGGLLVGVVVAALLLNHRSATTHSTAFRALMIIPGFAAVAYATMALDIGTVMINGTPVTVPRYVDWAVTTPILVGFVGYTAGAPRRWIVGVAVVDLLMILLGAAATAAAAPWKWVLYGGSSLMHLLLLVAIYRVFPSFAADYPQRRGLFKLLQNHIGLLWIGYPLLWLAGPGGFGLVTPVSFGLIIAYLDVVAKTPYVYFVWQRRDVFVTDSVSVDSAKPTNTPRNTGVSD